MSRWARSRDANEPEIIKALVAAGASVQQTFDMKGTPDLIVGYLGEDHLMEVKNPATRGNNTATKATGRLTREQIAPGGEFEGMPRDLNQNQAKWHRAWKGSTPAVVEYAHEALAHIGAPTHFCRCADCVADSALPVGAITTKGKQR